MPEIFNDQEKRLKKLCEFASLVTEGKIDRKLVGDYKPFTGTVSPEETMKVLDYLLTTGYSHEKVKGSVGKILNVFYESLSSFTWEKPGKDHFLHYLMLENRQAEKIMNEIRSVIKSIFGGSGGNDEILYAKLLSLLRELKEYELHYLKKENILFPYIEKAFHEYRCLKIMWSFHDDFRKCIRNLENILTGTPDKNRLNKELGKLFFVMFPIIFREEQIVFPVAYRSLSPADWNEMLEQSMEIGWCFNINPQPESSAFASKPADDSIDLGSGSLDAVQIELMLNRLPVDITFVDENDEVRYFSGPDHRIFPRSKAIIGRKVQNCHPAESVHIVNEIIESFRMGRKDHADFWIRLKGKFIHIRYFALRDRNNKYKGTIEVSQDVTDIRSLEGERRLLQWDEKH